MMKLIKKPIALVGLATTLFATHYAVGQQTSVSISIPSRQVAVDPMIYGQMLENVNDSMIYGGVTDLKGNVREHLFPHLRELDIPVMRWPGGTVVHEYRWENGIGPRADRPTVPNLAWNGIENYQFGTDEFLQWCRDIGTVPYINFNMGNQAQFKGSLGEALSWIEYTNGDVETPYGRLRASNGHRDPYHVKYWCLGNENYLTSNGGGHVREEAPVYAHKLKHWASTIHYHYPDLSLLAVGNTLKWNEAVLDSTGQFIDFLTQHYYITAKVRDGRLTDPVNTLFAPAKMEAHLALLGEQLVAANKKLGRADHPIRLSVDEWNNRHSIADGDKFKFTRNDPRRQFDVAVTAGTLNAFIRQSPHVGMANYIFPVNGHGLIRTVGNDDAFLTPTYEVFKQYRKRMVGAKLDVAVHGPSVYTADIHPAIDGDAREAAFPTESLPFIDAAAVLDSANTIQLSLVNRSHDTAQRVELTIPSGYDVQDVWELAHSDINTPNRADDREAVKPQVRSLNSKKGKIIIEVPPCGLQLITFTAK